MNKRTFAYVGVTVVTLIGGFMSYMYFTTRPLSPTQTINYNFNGLDIRVVYCRPSKRGRIIFGNQPEAIVPNGKYWRLGANEATEISFSKDVSVSGRPLKAGTYRMYAIPNDSTWQISFNSELGQWGANEPNYSKDIQRVEIRAERVATETEQFTIDLVSGTFGLSMNIDWDKTHLRVPITVN